ncbi:MAG: hypothetical protein IJH59_03360, partial [Firmicutes bacterium]|nr:hypothetical protein [Bacillota bacterium]
MVNGALLRAADEAKKRDRLRAASIKAERAELEAKWKKEYEQAEYEAAVRQYESAMESYSRELQG